jgi:uncharacterized protein DUF559
VVRKPVPTGRKSWPPHARFGLVTTADLLAGGLSDGAISKQVARGALRRRYAGVYSYGPGELSREAEWMAAVLAAGLGAFLGRRSAAALWEMLRDRRVISDVLAPRGRRPKGPVLVHTYRRLDPRDVTVHRGIPVTSIARTFVDLSDVLTVFGLVAAIRESAYHRPFDEPATREAMARANGRCNLHVLDAAIDRYLHGSAGTKSRNEDAFLVLIRELPEPLVNTTHEGEELDFYWPDRRLNVEVDGPGHLRPAVKRADARRDRKLRAAGYTILRFTDVELERAPEAVLARLMRKWPTLAASRGSSS